MVTLIWISLENGAFAADEQNAPFTTWISKLFRIGRFLSLCSLIHLEDFDTGASKLTRKEMRSALNCVVIIW